MQETYYIAVSMETTDNGPEFHMVTDNNPDAFKAKFAEMRGEKFINQQKTVHVVGEIQPSSIDKDTVKQSVADAIAEVKKHRGAYLSNTEAEEIFKHLRTIRSEAEK